MLGVEEDEATANQTSMSQPSCPAVVSLALGAYQIHGGEFATFSVIVTTTSLCWSVERRFSQFRRLHLVLERRGYALPAFPPRSLFRSVSQTFVERRRSHLQSYLNHLMEVPGVAADESLMAFLQASENFGRLSAALANEVSQAQRTVQALEETVRAYREQLRAVRPSKGDVLATFTYSQAAPQSVDSSVLPSTKDKQKCAQQCLELVDKLSGERPLSCGLRFQNRQSGLAMFSGLEGRLATSKGVLLMQTSCDTVFEALMKQYAQGAWHVSGDPNQISEGETEQSCGLKSWTKREDGCIVVASRVCENGLDAVAGFELRPLDDCFCLCTYVCQADTGDVEDEDVARRKVDSSPLILLSLQQIIFSSDMAQSKSVSTSQPGVSSGRAGSAFLTPLRRGMGSSVAEEQLSPLSSTSKQLSSLDEPTEATNTETGGFQTPQSEFSESTGISAQNEGHMQLLFDTAWQMHGKADDIARRSLPHGTNSTVTPAPKRISDTSQVTGSDSNNKDIQESLPATPIKSESVCEDPVKLLGTPAVPQNAIIPSQIYPGWGNGPCLIRSEDGTHKLHFDSEIPSRLQDGLQSGLRNIEFLSKNDVDIFEGASPGDGWTLISRDTGDTVTMRGEFDHLKLPVMKGITYFPFSPIQVAQRASQTDIKKQWDKMQASGQFLQKYDDHSCLVLEEFHGVLLVKGRHLIYARTAAPDENGTIWSIAEGLCTDYVQSPQGTRSVRGTLHIGSFVLRPYKDGSLVTYLASVDLSGSIPSSVTKIVQTRQPEVLKHLRAVLVKEAK